MSQTHITLLNDIAVIPIEPAANGQQRYGLISQLPKGAEAIVCGDGFSARTKKIECRGKFYFVFVQDIDMPLNNYD